MVERKKPMGDKWTDFVLQWQNSDHAGKVKLAESHNVTYDTSKHWVSEGDTTMIAPDDTDDVTEAVGQIVRTQARINLDFVTFDIETSNLKADFSIMLCACIKPFGGKPIVFRADSYPEWTRNRADDHRIVEDIVEELSKHAIVITHYGSKFDVPYIRAKAVKYGIPNLPPMFGIDTYRIAKGAFCTGSRRLKALARYFELGSKTEVEGGLWLEAAYTNNKAAMDEIVEHNIVDCDVLEKLACITFPYLRSMPKL